MLRSCVLFPFRVNTGSGARMDNVVVKWIIFTLIEASLAETCRNPAACAWAALCRQE